MYTVEFESDASVITSLDESDTCEDVEVIIGDDGVVFIRQFVEEMNANQIVCITYQQLLDIMAALKSPEGAFYARFKPAQNSNR
ncbi:hypothetical protein CRP2_gp25 [Roseobacter phage CRP-2]|jgi:hypothetical protein|nr:hypothetical protein CRP2_gp25 [Roseobacter phage CRP-2]